MSLPRFNIGYDQFAAFTVLNANFETEPFILRGTDRFVVHFDSELYPLYVTEFLFKFRPKYFFSSMQGDALILENNDKYFMCEVAMALAIDALICKRNNYFTETKIEWHITGVPDVDTEPADITQQSREVSRTLLNSYLIKAGFSKELIDETARKSNNFYLAVNLFAKAFFGNGKWSYKISK